MADVANFNERFLATFDYYFIVNNQKTSPQKGFLLPGEENFLAFLGADEVVFSGVPELILENVRWLRISAHDIPDVSSWQKERLDFTTADFQFINRGSVADVTSYAIQFKLTNNSAYGFVNPKFYVALYQGQTLVGILPLEITKFLSGETRDVDLRSFTPNLNVTSMSVFPLVNIYDDSIFLAPGA